MTKNRHPEFPLFSEFLRGYLHQDAVPEHGNAVAAAKAYLADLSDKDRKALSREIPELREKLAKLTPADLNQQLGNLGSAWTFDSQEEFQQVLRILEKIS